VDLFFVISGFIMSFTTRSRYRGGLNFMLGRVTRIVPLYWIMTLTVYCVALFAPNLVKATSTNVAELIQSLLFIPFFKAGKATQPTLFVGWTLNYEMFFYALFALCGLAGSRLISNFCCIGLLIIAVIAGILVHPTDASTFLYSRPIVLEFGLGQLIGIAYPLFERYKLGRISAPLAVLGALCAFWCLTGNFDNQLWDIEGPFRVPLRGGAATALVALAVWLEVSGKRVPQGMCTGLGDASYAIYLTHAFVVIGLLKLADQMHLAGALSILASVAVLAIACGVGFLVHILIERPSTNLVRRIFSAGDRNPERPAFNRIG